MKAWMLYNDLAESLRPDNFAVRRFNETAEREGVKLEIFSPDAFDLVVTRDDRKSVVVDGASRELPDVLMPRMGAATSYFSLAVIRHLERLGVTSINDSASIEHAKDKLYTQQILAASDIPFPRTALARHPVNGELIERQIGFPCVVKTLSGSQGAGVYLAESRQKFEDLVHIIHESRGNANLIIQEFIESSYGKDLRVLVVGGRAIACVKRESKDGSFKANFSRGGGAEPYELTLEIESLAVNTARVLGLEIAGIDLLFAGDGFKVCEANSAPGFEAIETSLDIDIPAEFFRYIRLRTGVID